MSMNSVAETTVRPIATQAVQRGIVVLVREVERCTNAGSGLVYLIPELETEHRCGEACELQAAIEKRDAGVIR